MKMVSPSTVVPSKYVDQKNDEPKSFYSPNSMDGLQNNDVLHKNNNDDLESINMAEFLESILFSDETETPNQSHDHVQQQLQYPTAAGSSAAMPIILQQPATSSSVQDINTSWAAAYHKNGITAAEQGSFSLPTVDQLLQEEIQKLQLQHLQNTSCNWLNPTLHCQKTYGETMSLEEFLMKYGALEVNNIPVHDHQLAPSIQPRSAATLQTLANNNPINSNSSSNNYNMNNELLQIISTSAINPVNHVILQGGYNENGKEVEKRGRKRKGITEGVPMEVVRERRVQRMIKNRESASKSRCRRQTYNLQLQAELAQLRAENDTLKNQVLHVMNKMEQHEEMKRKDEVGRKLRRSSSCPSSSFM